MLDNVISMLRHYIYQRYKYRVLANVPCSTNTVTTVYKTTALHISAQMNYLSMIIKLYNISLNTKNINNCALNINYINIITHVMELEYIVLRHNCMLTISCHEIKKIVFRRFFI